MLVSETIRHSVAPVPPALRLKRLLKMPGPLRTKWRRPPANEDTIGPAIIFLGFFGKLKTPEIEREINSEFRDSIFQTSWSTRICETMARVNAFFVERP